MRIDPARVASRSTLATAAFAAALLLGYSGCIFQALTPTRVLTEQVYAYNDETRWARTDLAADRVAPDFRGRFVESHHQWGRDWQIADTDLTHVQLADDLQTANSLVAVTWYDQRSMTVHGSVLRQHWVRLEDNYYLDGEEIVDGDARLLAAAELPAAESGGSNGATNGASTGAEGVTPDMADEPLVDEPTAGGESASADDAAFDEDDELALNQAAR